MTVVSGLTCTWHSSISEIEAKAWNSLCVESDRPFMQWEWLRLLEESGSVGPDAGWTPCFLALRTGGRLAAAAALYIKSHSRGEFVFDQDLARAAEDMGLRYYPKMVGMSPFTPVPSYRFLIAPGLDEAMMSITVAQEIEAFCGNRGIAGCNFHFVNPAWGRILEQLGYQVWLHQGFAWLNAGFCTFEDYLAGLKSNHRRNIRRERRRLREHGIRVRRLFGDEIPEAYYALMYDVYARHNDQFGQWSCKYLTPAFFSGLRERFGHRVLITAAYEPDQDAPMAMALLIVSKDRLLGRYWGAAANVDYLHFELCYYQPMEWMIEHGLRLFDPGMGGAHKAFRGFVCIPNYSLHRFFHPRLAGIMERAIGECNHAGVRDIAAFNSILPYRRKG